jgi:hypothetical protein
MKKPKRRKLSKRSGVTFVEAKRAPKRAIDTQVGGSHYMTMKNQPIQFIMDNDLNYVEGRVVEYMARWRMKGGVVDLHKARHLLSLKIEHEEGG